MIDNSIPSSGLSHPFRSEGSMLAIEFLEVVHAIDSVIEETSDFSIREGVLIVDPLVEFSVQVYLGVGRVDVDSGHV